MLAFIRIFLAALVFFVGSLILAIVFMLRPFDVRNGLLFCRLVPPIAVWVMGLKLEIRNQKYMFENHPSVFIGNHQSALDLLIHACVQCVPVLSMGKKELKFLPFFGWMFWLSGQIFLDRRNRTKAVESLENAAKRMKAEKVSVWMFPEGTRSRGQGLLPFKRGAFHLAISAQVPIVTIAASPYRSIHLNSWRPGKVVLDVLPPVSTAGMGSNDVDTLLQICRKSMEDGIARLDQELDRPS